MGVKGHLNCLRVLGFAKFGNQHYFPLVAKEASRLAQKELRWDDDEAVGKLGDPGGGW